MNEMFFQISSIQRKMETNNNLQVIMKAITGLVVFTIFFCSLNQADTMKVAWIISIAVIVLLFIFDSYKYDTEISGLFWSNLLSK